MKMRNSGPVWFLICGIPALALCALGMLAVLAGWHWLDERCRRWTDELLGRRSSDRPTLKS